MSEEEKISRAYSILALRLKDTLLHCRNYEESEGDFQPPEVQILRESGDPDAWFALVSNPHMAELHVLSCFMGSDEPDGPVKPLFSSVTLPIEAMPALVRCARSILARSRDKLGRDGTPEAAPRVDTPVPVTNRKRDRT